MSAKQMVESLEQRRLLSVSVYGDTLVVKGTDNLFVPDTIQVLENVSNAKYVVTQNSGIMKVTKIINAAPIRKIEVYGCDGDDFIKVDASTFQPFVKIDGGDGNDFMTGGLEQDLFCGGEGEDTVNYGVSDFDKNGDPKCNSVLNDNAHFNFKKGVWVTLDNCFNDGVQNLGFPSLTESDNVDGGVDDVIGTEYNDVLKGTMYLKYNGSTHHDELWDLGDNVLEGRGGDDQLYGFGGDDVLTGGCGIDQMFGGDGCDTIDACDGEADIAIDGGDDTDGAIVDDVDLPFVSSVEELVF